MTLVDELEEKLKTDTVKDEELPLCLEVGNFYVAGLAIFKIIERNYCDSRIVEGLTKLSGFLQIKFLGPWKYGHVAIATLALLDNDDSKSRYEELYVKLNDLDKFLVDNCINSGAFKM